MKNKDEMPDYSGVIEMANSMGIVENFLMRKGRFVGDMVHISIDDLAENVQRLEAEKAELVEVLEAIMKCYDTLKAYQKNYEILQKHK